MFRFFFLLFGLSLTQAISIKVSGNLNLGNQLTKVAKELITQLVDTGVIPKEIVNAGQSQSSHEDQQNSPQWYDDEDGLVDETNKSKQRKKKYLQKDDNDVPVLDKMMQGDLDKLHLYGIHKQERKKPKEFTGEPLNNVHL